MEHLEMIVEKQETLFKSASIEVLRAKISNEKNSVIIKRIISPTPEAFECYRLKNEFKILNKFSLAKSVKAIRLFDERTLILEDTGGESLKSFLKKYKLNIRDFFHLAIQIADCLDEVHKNNIIHKDIKPSNIIIQPETNEIKLTDFGIATLLPKEYIPSIGKLEGSIEYLSPEQTGRTGTALDYRTDLYSLGITFYEMLTGFLPFESKDQNQLLHSHIAQLPKPLSEIDPTIPETISQVVSKLLSKSPEARYQSAEGLKLDLMEISEANNRLSQVKFFVGKNDFSEKFSIPQKLYGRDREIQKLKESFANLFAGTRKTSSLQLIAGYSGIGKTSLVLELNQPVAEKNGIFISGKFEQYQKNIPFFAMVQAFRELIRQLLAKENSELQKWKKDLKEALGNIGQVIIDVVPEVELIMGKQPTIPEVPPDQAFNRFNYAFSQFVRVFAKAEHPLVLFLDDLQWADMASLSLLKNLLTDTDIVYLFVLGAYRDNEIDVSHSLNFFLHDLEKNGLLIENLKLGNLEKDSIQSLVCDSLLCGREESLELTELLMDKTDGNPFFTRQFLQSLYEENLIYISERKWKWNILEIKNKSVSDNVLDLMVQRIEKLSREAQTLLGHASCIGNQFDLKILGFVLQKSVVEVIPIIEDCILFGLLIPLSDSYKWIESHSNSINCVFKFLHDRVQQASYKQVPDEKKQNVHFAIGKILLEHTPREELQEKLFDIVDQLNYGLDLIESNEEKIKIVELNMQAGKQAKSSVAYNGALGYFKNAIKLLSSDSWQSQYSLIYQCVTELGETEFLCGNFEEADKYFEIGLENASSRLDKAGIYNLKVILYTGQGKYNQAIETGLLGLQLYDFKVPENFGVTNIFKEIRSLKNLIGENPADTIQALPEIVDKDKLMFIHLLINLIDSTYFTDKLLNGYIVLQSIQFSLMNGMSSAGLISLVSFGNLLCANGDHQLGFAIGKYINEITFSKNLSLIKSKSDNIFCAHINPWKRHIKAAFEIQLEGFKVGIETGDISYASYNAGWYLWYKFFYGTKLESTQKEAAKFLEFALKVKNKNVELLIKILMHSIKIIQGNSLQNENAALLEEAQKSEMKITLFGYLLVELELCYQLEKFDSVDSIIKQCLEIQDSVIGLYFAPEFHFYYTLILLAIHQRPETDQAQNEKQITYELKIWKRWAEAAPENYLHKYLLLQAELARVKGETLEAMELYDQSIESAKTNHYLLNVALASKLAGKFHLSLNKPKFAYIYFMDSFYGYKSQGANLFANEIENNYLKKHFHYFGKERRQQTKFDSSSTTLASIDLNSLLKASRVISSEVKLELLLKNLLYIIIENAGAERGVLLLEDKGEYLVFAESKTNSQTNLERRKTDNSILPLSVIQFVIHTKENVILHQAKEDKQFSKDSYILQNPILSVACFPILNQNQLLAILYLENNLLPNAFTPERVEILNVLCSQAAVSIQNAEVYENLEEMIKNRTIELKTLYEEVKGLKISQDADYYLTSVLLSPLQVNNNTAQNIKTDFIIEQKKKVQFRALEYEIGGDLCITETIKLNGKNYTVFLNGDAMGKSIQGAGGALIAGVVFKSGITRTKLEDNINITPEDWIYERYWDLQKVFLSFDGIMLISICLGLIDTKSYEMFYVNAEHQSPVLYKDNVASYLEHPVRLAKIGSQFNEKKFFVDKYQLSPGDSLFIGSDGKDDLKRINPETGEDSIQSDPELFLNIVNKTNGKLKQIVEEIKKIGTLIDDLSILHLTVLE